MSTFHRNEFEAESDWHSGRQCGLRVPLLEAPGNKRLRCDSGLEKWIRIRLAIWNIISVGYILSCPPNSD